MASSESPAAAGNEFYVLKQGGMHGPFTRADLEARLADGLLSMEDFAQTEGVPIWQPLARILGSEDTVPRGAIAPDWKSIITWAWMRLRYDIDEQSVAAGMVCLGVGLLVLALSHWTFLFWLPWTGAALLAALALLQRRRMVAGLLMLLGVIVLPLGVFIWHATLKPAPALPFEPSKAESSRTPQPQLDETSPTTAKATPEQEKAFLAAYKKASESKDESTLQSFLYTKGADPAVLQDFINMLKINMGAKIKAIELLALTSDEMTTANKVILPDGIKVSKKLVIETEDGSTGKTVEIFVADKNGKLVFPVPSGLPREETAPANSEVTAWTHDGSTLKVVKVLAENGDFLRKPGVAVRFFDQEVAPGDSTSGKNSVEVFFPQNGAGYDKPISITFRSAKGSSSRVQESNSSGYDGHLVSMDGKVSGWVKINGVGPDRKSSITAKFEAALSSQ